MIADLAPEEAERAVAELRRVRALNVPDEFDEVMATLSELIEVGGEPSVTATPNA